MFFWIDVKNENGEVFGIQTQKVEEKEGKIVLYTLDKGIITLDTPIEEFLTLNDWLREYM